MPRSSGTYSAPASSWNPTTNGASATKADWDALLSDLSSALTQSIAKDGQTVLTADLPMGGFKLTNIGSAVSRTDAASFGQAQDGAYAYLTSVAGTNTITASLSTPTLTAYVAGMVVRFVAAGSNTGAATLNINSLGAKAITKNGTSALVTGDILIGATYQLIYDGTQWQLNSPVGLFAASGANMDITSLGALTTVSGTPNFSGNATGQTQAATDSSTKLATTAFAQSVSAKIQPVTASVAASALTVTLNPTTLDFRSSTLGSGTVVTRTVSAAISLVVSNGSTLGTVNTVKSRIAVLAIDNAGTVELAVCNIGYNSQLDETLLISTTAEGGAGAADSANAIYSTTARTNVAFRIVGYVESTQATAGTWATSPSTIQGFGGNAAAAHGSVGYNQAWTNVTRNQATTYYNDTGRPIIVNVHANNVTTSYAYLVATVGGVTINGTGQATSAFFSLQFMVPPGQSYSWDVSSGTVNTITVRELR